MFIWNVCTNPGNVLRNITLSNSIWIIGAWSPPYKKDDDYDVDVGRFFSKSGKSRIFQLKIYISWRKYQKWLKVILFWKLRVWTIFQYMTSQDDSMAKKFYFHPNWKVACNLPAAGRSPVKGWNNGVLSIEELIFWWWIIIMCERARREWEEKYGPPAPRRRDDRGLNIYHPSWCAR